MHCQIKQEICKAKQLTDAARDRKVDDAIAASDVVIADLSSLFATINKEAESKVFLLPDDPEYEKRLDAYRSKMAEGKSTTLMKKDGDWMPGEWRAWTSRSEDF